MPNTPRPDKNERKSSINEDVFLRRQIVSYAIDSLNYTIQGLGIDSTPVRTPEHRLTSNSTAHVPVLELAMPKEFMAQIDENPSKNHTPLTHVEFAQKQVHDAFIDEPGE